MTQDEILEMVREAGGSDVGGPGWTTWVGTQSTEFLERFANLVAAKYEQKIQDLEDLITELQERQA
jgi:ABC-type transporter MlaC component